MDSDISETCQACCWIHRRHFTGEYTLKHTQGGSRGMTKGRERGRGGTGGGENRGDFHYSFKNQQTVSPPLFRSLGNRQHVELRISRQLLAGSAWLHPNWNTVTIKPHTHTHRH